VDAPVVEHTHTPAGPVGYHLLLETLKPVEEIGQLVRTARSSGSVRVRHEALESAVWRLDQLGETYGKLMREFETWLEPASMEEIGKEVEYTVRNSSAPFPYPNEFAQECTFLVAEKRPSKAVLCLAGRGIRLYERPKGDPFCWSHRNFLTALEENDEWVNDLHQLIHKLPKRIARAWSEVARAYPEDIEFYKKRCETNQRLEQMYLEARNGFHRLLSDHPEVIDIVIQQYRDRNEPWQLREAREALVCFAETVVSVMNEHHDAFAPPDAERHTIPWDLPALLRPFAEAMYDREHGPGAWREQLIAQLVDVIWCEFDGVVTDEASCWLDRNSDRDPADRFPNDVLDEVRKRLERIQAEFARDEDLSRERMLALSRGL
jgi:hypothetical protein